MTDNVLITGGTGTLGRALIRLFRERKYKGKVIVTGSTGKSCSEVKHMFSKMQNLRVRQGNIRDKERYREIIRLDRPRYIIHAAAMKRIVQCEAEAIEAKKTNVDGTVNLIDLALEYDCEHFVAVSTDKAASPITFYGHTKLLMEQIVLHNNNRRRDFNSCCVRYGNVYGSRGSVIEQWMKQYAEYGHIFLRDPEATRFFFNDFEAAQFIYGVLLDLVVTGHINIPDMHSVHLGELAEFYAMKLDCAVMPGVSVNEKRHEILYTEEETQNGLILISRIDQKASSKDCLAPKQRDWIEHLEKGLRA